MQGDLGSFTIHKSVYANIEHTVGSRPAETGGLLGMKNGIVCAYYFDEHGSCTSNEYQPNTEACEHVANELWHPAGIHICGFVHSHASSMEPSRSDVQYTQLLYDAIIADAAAASSFYTVIASSVFHGATFSLRPYKCQYAANGDFSLFPVDITLSVQG